MSFAEGVPGENATATKTGNTYKITGIACGAEQHGRAGPQAFRSQRHLPLGFALAAELPLKISTFATQNRYHPACRSVRAATDSHEFHCSVVSFNARTICPLMQVPEGNRRR
jgi:Mycobacterium 19 kDa lipoprotein antigen